MLIVTVKSSEIVTLERDGQPIGTVQVSKRRDGSVRVALDFPREVRILRGELAPKEDK